MEDGRPCNNWRRDPVHWGASSFLCCVDHSDERKPSCFQNRFLLKLKATPTFLRSVNTGIPGGALSPVLASVCTGARRPPSTIWLRATWEARDMKVSGPDTAWSTQLLALRGQKQFLLLPSSDTSTEGLRPAFVGCHLRPGLVQRRTSKGAGRGQSSGKNLDQQSVITFCWEGPGPLSC